MAPKKRPAKISTTAKAGMYSKSCPKCDTVLKAVRMVRHSKPSGMHWVCDSCGFEAIARDMR